MHGAILINTKSRSFGRLRSSNKSMDEASKALKISKSLQAIGSEMLKQIMVPLTIEVPATTAKTQKKKLPTVIRKQPSDISSDSCNSILIHMNHVYGFGLTQLLPEVQKHLCHLV